MCDDYYIMKQPLINKMYDLVLNKQEEYCIIFDFNEETRVLDFSDKHTIGTVVIENGKERATCSSPPKGNNLDYPYVFHSHPKHRRSYPSLEDIMKPLRHPEVNLSVIATRWGIYVIKSDEESRTFSLKFSCLDRDTQKEIYEEKLNKYLFEIQKVEDHKGYKEKIYKNLNDYDIKFIREMLDKIREKSKLNIKFCPWKDLNKEPM